MLRCGFGLACLCCLLFAAGCDADQQNGQDCLKDDDCESRRCVARVCQQPGTLVPPDTAAVDSVAEVNDAADSAEVTPDVPAEDAADASDVTDAGGG